MTVRCTNGIVEVVSDSDSSKKYVVQASAGDAGFPFCNCVAYVMKRNKNRKAAGMTGKQSDIPGWCKHLDRYVGQLCDYSGPDGTKACPKCGGELVPSETTTITPVAEAKPKRAKPQTKKELEKESAETANKLIALLDGLGAK